MLMATGEKSVSVLVNVTEKEQSGMEIEQFFESPIQLTKNLNN